ncbi:MAG: hypothetical protein RL557_928 [archaeon]|jgi:ABC-type lipoprotein release transport system permease subunit
MKRITNLVWIGITVLVAALIVYFFMNSNSSTSLKDNLTAGITPEELSENKENYEGKNVLIKNAYVPSEAFIYIKTTDREDKIFLEPPNKSHCRHFDIRGKFQKDAQTERWELIVSSSICLEGN